MRKSEYEAYRLLKDMAINNSRWPSERVSLKKPVKMYDIDLFSNSVAQVSLLTKKPNSKVLKPLPTRFKLVLPCVNFAMAPFQA